MKRIKILGMLLCISHAPLILSMKKEIEKTERDFLNKITTSIMQKCNLADDKIALLEKIKREDPYCENPQNKEEISQLATNYNTTKTGGNLLLKGILNGFLDRNTNFDPKQFEHLGIPINKK